MATSQEFQNLELHAPFYGGAFEIGGHMNLAIEAHRRKQGVYTYAFPIVMIHDKNPEKISAMAKRAGIILPEGSRTLKLTYGEAVEFGDVIFDFAPSRREVILGFQNWRNEDTTEGRVDVAREYQLSDKPKLSPESYHPLVRNPQFLAGVYESRGNLYKRTIREKPLVRMLVISTNHPLLEAIKDEFPGSLSQHSQRGWSLELGEESSIIYMSRIRTHLLDYRHEGQEFIDKAA